MSIITISNYEKKQFFFSNDHCQKHNLGEDWVPCTARIPMQVVPRPGLESGMITNKEEYKRVFYTDHEEIPNPQPEHQA